MSFNFIDVNMSKLDHLSVGQHRVRSLCEDFTVKYKSQESGHSFPEIVVDIIGVRMVPLGALVNTSSSEYLMKLFSALNRVCPKTETETHTQRK